MSTTAGTRRTCPHCEALLNTWAVPDATSWDEKTFLVCFNDDCAYYQKGWAWMKAEYGREASYRYSLNPATGAASPLPVWSDSATRQMIVDADDDDGGES
jgi:hypothetical protein